MEIFTKKYVLMSDGQKQIEIYGLKITVFCDNETDFIFEQESKILKALVEEKIDIKFVEISKIGAVNPDFLYQWNYENKAELVMRFFNWDTLYFFIGIKSNFLHSEQQKFSNLPIY